MYWQRYDNSITDQPVVVAANSMLGVNEFQVCQLEEKQLHGYFKNMHSYWLVIQKCT